MTVKLEEKYAPRKMFLDMGGFTSTDFTTFLRENNIDVTEYGYPVFQIMEALNNSRKKGRFGKDSDLDADLKREKIEGQRIMNALKLKKLIPRQLAVDRMRTTCQAIANKIQYGAKLAAPRIPGITNVRDIESIIINGWESVIDSLMEEAERLESWEDYAITIRTDPKQRGERVAESAEEDLSTEDSGEDPTFYSE